MEKTNSDFPHFLETLLQGSYSCPQLKMRKLRIRKTRNQSPTAFLSLIPVAEVRLLACSQGHVPPRPQVSMLSEGHPRGGCLLLQSSGRLTAPPGLACLLLSRGPQAPAHPGGGARLIQPGVRGPSPAPAGSRSFINAL